MKKKFAIIFASASLIVTMSFGQTISKVPKEIETSFKDIFQDSNYIIKWEIISNLYKVTFNKDNQNESAFFDEKGELVDVSRNISSISLPIILSSKLNDLLVNGKLLELFEVDSDNEVTYYATIEETKKGVIYKSIGSDWAFYKHLRN